MDSSKAVLKTVAVFEAAKGVLLLLVGIGAWSLVHHDIHMIAAALVGRLHLNPAQGFAGSFVEAASQLTDARLWTIAAMGCGYAAFRFVESYGLWFGKVWAEWLAVVTGGIFVPLEFYEVVKKLTFIRVSALIINIAVVCAMAAILVKNRRARKHPRT
ncbi:MAG TPA: DUF2127 domain-containing protein [Rariglobus sp.]